MTAYYKVDLKHIGKSTEVKLEMKNNIGLYNRKLMRNGLVE